MGQAFSLPICRHPDFFTAPKGTPLTKFGTLARRAGRGPSTKNLDFSVFRNFRLTEKLNLQFRAEAFNLFNHPNFNLPDNFLGSPTFGQILSAEAPRHIQFGVKLLF